MVDLRNSNLKKFTKQKYIKPKAKAMNKLKIFNKLFYLGKIITKNYFIKGITYFNLCVSKNFKNSSKIIIQYLVSFLNNDNKHFTNKISIFILYYVYNINILNTRYLKKHTMINTIKNNFKLFLYYLYSNSYCYSNIFLSNDSYFSNNIYQNNTYYPYSYYCLALNKLNNYYYIYNNYIFKPTTKTTKNYKWIYSKLTKRFKNMGKEKELVKLSFLRNKNLFYTRITSINIKFHYRYRDPKSYLHPYWQKDEFLKKKFRYFKLGSSFLIGAFFKHNYLKKKRSVGLFRKTIMPNFWFQKKIKRLKFISHANKIEFWSINRSKYKFFNKYLINLLNIHQNFLIDSNLKKFNNIKVKKLFFNDLFLSNKKLYNLHNSFLYFIKNKKLFQNTYFLKLLKYNTLLKDLSYKNKNNNIYCANTYFNYKNFFSKQLKNLYFLKVKTKKFNNNFFYLKKNNQNFNKNNFIKLQYIKKFRLKNLKTVKINYFLNKKLFSLFKKKSRKLSFLQRNFRVVPPYRLVLNYRYEFQTKFKKIKWKPLRYRLSLTFRKFNNLSYLGNYKKKMERYKKWKFKKSYVRYLKHTKKRLSLLANFNFINTNFSRTKIINKKLFNWAIVDFNNFVARRSKRYKKWVIYFKSDFKKKFINSILNNNLNSLSLRSVRKSIWMKIKFKKKKRRKYFYKKKKVLFMVKKLAIQALGLTYNKYKNIFINKHHYSKNKKLGIIKKIFNNFLYLFDKFFINVNTKLFSKFSNQNKINVYTYWKKSFLNNNNSNKLLSVMNNEVFTRFNYFNYIKKIQKNRNFIRSQKIKRFLEAEIKNNLIRYDEQKSKLNLKETDYKYLFLSKKNKRSLFTIKRNFKIINIRSKKLIRVKKLLIFMSKIKQRKLNWLKSKKYPTDLLKILPIFFKRVFFFNFTKNSINIKKKEIKYNNFINYSKNNIFNSFKKTKISPNILNSYYFLISNLSWKHSLNFWTILYNRFIFKKKKFISINLNKKRKIKLNFISFLKVGNKRSKKLKKYLSLINLLNIKKLQSKCSNFNKINWSLNNMIRKNHNYFLTLFRYFWLLKPVDRSCYFDGFGKLWNFCNLNNEGVINKLGFLNYNFLTYAKDNQWLSFFSHINNHVGASDIYGCSIDLWSTYNDTLNALSYGIDDIKAWELKKKKDKEEEQKKKINKTNNNPISLIKWEKQSKEEKEALYKRRESETQLNLKNIVYESITPLIELDNDELIENFNLRYLKYYRTGLRDYDVVGYLIRKFFLNFNVSNTYFFSKNFILKYSSIFNYSFLVSNSKIFFNQFLVNENNNQSQISFLQNFFLTSYFNTENISSQNIKFFNQLVMLDKIIFIKTNIKKNQNKVLKLKTSPTIIYSKLYFGLLKSYNYTFLI